MKKPFSLIMAACLVVSLLTGCGSNTPAQAPAADSGSNASWQEVSADRKVMTIGDTTFNSENWEETVDPHRTYNGWACIRYGIGETLVHYTDTMELEPWLAKSWENDGNCTWT
ncbi:MAG: ABC transporter substrate-binding protein, partial [Eubacterium sp.]|nr:ABC transporter substrate-binding protein [Eubacterium sp.]